MTLAISKFDHVAITVADLGRATGFYVRFGGRFVRSYEVDDRPMVNQVRIGSSMLNIHQAGHGHPLVASRPTPGSADLCFRWRGPIATAIQHLQDTQISIIEGPVERYGSNGVLGQSVYFRDPDGNLLELLSTITG